MTNRSIRARRCSFETLENRRLLAGDVFARIDRGNLIIRGDDASNALLVAPGAVPGQVVITGLDDFTTNLQTRINGVSNGELTLTGFTGRIDIALGGGNDDIRVTGLTSRGVTIDLGRGHNRLNLDDQLVNGDVFVKSADGNDSVAMFLNTVNGSFTATLGDGNNDISSQDCNVGRDVKLVAGRGGDTFVFRTWNIGQKLTIDLGIGANIFSAVDSPTGGRVEYRGGSDNDQFNWQGGDSDSIDVNLGDGANQLRFVLGVVNRDASFKGGSGDDLLDVAGSKFHGSLSVNFGDGANRVGVVDSPVDRDLTVILGRGNDTVDYTNQTVGGNFVVRSGAGDDDVDFQNVDVVGSLTVDVGDGKNHYLFNLGHVGRDAKYIAGRGDDRFEIASLTYDRNVSGNLGDGENTFLLTNAGAKRVDYQGGKNVDWFKFEAGSVESITANLGDGDNRADLFGVNTSRDVCYTAGRGNDTFALEEGLCAGNATVNVGDGDNFLRFQYGVGGNVALRGGRGADNFDVNAINAPLYRSLSVDLGDGVNTLELFHVRTTGKAEIKGGKNSDTVNMFDIAFATLYMSLGSGDDTSTIASASVTGKATFDGGQGNDTFNTGNGNPVTYGTLDRKNFEIIQNVS